MVLETGTLVFTPGVKPTEPETSVVKGESMQCVGPILDCAGRMRKSFTDQDGNAQIKDNGALDKSLLVNRSLSDIANDTKLDDKHICAAQRGQKRRGATRDYIGLSRSTAWSTMVLRLHTQLCMVPCQNALLQRLALRKLCRLWVTTTQATLQK